MRTDQEIQQDVMAEIKWEPLLNSAEIGVAVKSGVVTLSGMVDTYTKKLLAEKAVKRVAGVKAVAQDLEVTIARSGQKNDTEIAEAALTALKWHSSILEQNIKLKVDNGWVTLEGEVEWEFLKESATDAVENIAGVRGVTNIIKIKPMVDPVDIKKKIRNAFHRSASVDSENITIETVDNKVILKGKVRSWAEKKEAERAAWLAPGVNAIDNRLVIDTEVYAY